MQVKKNKDGSIIAIKSKKHMLQKVGKICFCKSGPVVVRIIDELRLVTIAKSKIKSLKSDIDNVNRMLKEAVLNEHTL